MTYLSILVLKAYGGKVSWHHLLKMAVVLISAITAFLIILPAACASSSKSPSSPGPNEVWLMGGVFVPDTITVPVGTTIIWTNTTLEYHTVTSDDNLFDMPLDRGASFNFTFTEPGTFPYFDRSTDPPIIGKVIVQ